MGNNQSMERDEITTNILEKFHNQLNNSCHLCWEKKMSDLSMYKHFFLNHMAIVEIKALYTIVSKKTWSTDCIYTSTTLDIELVPLSVHVTTTRTTPLLFLSGGRAESLCEP